MQLLQRLDALLDRLCLLEAAAPAAMRFDGIDRRLQAAEDTLARCYKVRSWH